MASPGATPSPRTVVGSSPAGGTDGHWCRTAVSTSSFTPNHCVPQLSGVIATAVMHLWRRNVMLSLLTGTAVCFTLAKLRPFDLTAVDWSTRPAAAVERCRK